MNEELKPCPFCGSKDVGFQYVMQGKTTVAAKCGNCGAASDAVKVRNKIDSMRKAEEKAAESWNTRHEATCTMAEQQYTTQPTWVCSNCNRSVYKVDEYCPHCKAKVVG